MVSNDNSSLEKILAPIIDDLKNFDLEYKRAIKSDVPLINTITKYMMRKKGKNIRLHEIDQFINRYGNTEETRDFINKIVGLKLFKEDNYKNLILDKEEKKLA